MTNFEDCSYQLESAEDVPEPFRSSLRQVLPIGGADTMIYTPPCRGRHFTHGPCVLAVMGDGWACIEYTPSGDATIVRSDFSGTLFIELTEVLLSGALKIHFEDGSRVRSLSLAFNTVRESMYLDALRRMLHAINGVPLGPPVDRSEDLGVLEALPRKFQKAAWSATLSDEHVRAVACWPATTVGYNRLFHVELAPEAMLALSDHELIVVAEEKANSLLHVGRENKYGEIATFVPLSRLHDYRLAEGTGQLDRLELGIGRRGATERLLVEYPRAHGTPVKGVIERVFREKGGHLPMKAKPKG